MLFDYMHAHTTIPGADLAVVEFSREGEPWLGILKLNYKNGYTHCTETVGRGTGQLHHPAAGLSACTERARGGRRLGQPPGLFHASAGEEI